MTYNLIAYLIYLMITVLITIWVGWLFYKNGFEYLKTIFPDSNELALSVNKLLLVGYYLTNIGYCVYMLKSWKTITSLLDLLNEVSWRVSLIILLLAGLHYFNLISLAIWRKISSKNNLETKINHHGK